MYKMKEKRIFLFTLIMMLILSSCGDNSPVMTREYVIKQGLLTEEELRGVDFDTMAESYSLKEGSEENLDVRDFFQENKYYFPLPGYGLVDYLWISSDTKAGEEFTEEDIDQIRAIGLMRQIANFDTCVVFDFSDKKSYLWRLYQTGDEPTSELLLTDDQIETIKSLMSSCAVYDWDQKYRGKVDKDVFDTEFVWRLYYALEDGRVYSHSGSGAWENGEWGNGAPESYNDLYAGFATLLEKE